MDIQNKPFTEQVTAQSAQFNTQEVRQEERREQQEKVLEASASDPSRKTADEKLGTNVDKWA